jgi:hypothetical protein
MEKVAESRTRAVLHVSGGEPGDPAAYLLLDPEAGGILVNTPPFHPRLAGELGRQGRIGFLFLPSRLGARDVDVWREALGAEALAGRDEVAGIDGEVDQPIDGNVRLSRDLVFLPMSGRTPGTTALFCRHRPGFLFLGPALEPGGDGWPTLAPHDDDWSWENRMMGAPGLKDLRFEYAFTDRAGPDTRFGPGADAGIGAALDRFYA